MRQIKMQITIPALSSLILFCKTKYTKGKNKNKIINKGNQIWINRPTKDECVVLTMKLENFLEKNTEKVREKSLVISQSESEELKVNSAMSTQGKDRNEESEAKHD